MCGICGFTNPPADMEAHTNLVRKMAALLHHRGPDSDGYFHDACVSLGFRRLSIIDLSTGDQPLGNEDSSIQIVFNGEIYNFQSLRSTLEKKGHVFRTKSDTETIVHAYEEYGVRCVDHFRGMFAIALWDSNKRQLVLLRDRVGKKPLFYAHQQGQFVFASELKALLAHPAIAHELDQQAVANYLTWGYIPDPASIVKNIRKLAPAHSLIYDLEKDSVTVERYWDLKYLPKRPYSLQEAALELRQILEESVRLRMISDVPLGALLSGGVDSSVVVGLMAKMSAQPIKTFTIGFEDQAFSELPYARKIAQKYATDHHEFVIRPTLYDTLEELVWYLDEPIADISVVPSYYLTRLAREYVTVVLNGDGGDESFAGYRHYQAVLTHVRYQQLPLWIRQGVISPILNAVARIGSGGQLVERIRRLDSRSENTPQQEFWRWMQLFPLELRRRLSFDVAATPNDQDCHEEASLGILDWMLCHDIHNVLPGDLLVKMDRMSMANSVEARSPLLDQEVLEFAARLPESYKLQGFNSKRIFRLACRDLLEPELHNRPKQGFTVPIEDWMRGELRERAESLLFDSQARNHAFLDVTQLRTLWDEHQSNVVQHGRRLWGLMILELWQREFL